MAKLRSETSAAIDSLGLRPTTLRRTPAGRFIFAITNYRKISPIYVVLTKFLSLIIGPAYWGENLGIIACAYARTLVEGST